MKHKLYELCSHVNLLNCLNHAVFTAVHSLAIYVDGSCFSQ
jgi:hypothetical protein